MDENKTEIKLPQISTETPATAEDVQAAKPIVERTEAETSLEKLLNITPGGNIAVIKILAQTLKPQK